MKKIAFSILAAVLLLTLVCGSAFAVTGDITTKDVKAYADPNFTKYIGTIPAKTSVLVRAYGSYADIYVNGVECFVKPSGLTCGKKDYDYIGYATLKSGSNVYQRPTTSSKYTTTSSNIKVLVYAASDGYAMVRTTGKGVFGFVSAKNLTDLKAR